MFTVEEIQFFIIDFYLARPAGIRLGQHFINTYHERLKDRLPFPELFYEEDLGEAERMLWELCSETVDSPPDLTVQHRSTRESS